MTDRINYGNKRGSRKKNKRTGRNIPTGTNWKIYSDSSTIQPETSLFVTDCDDGGCEACYEYYNQSSTESKVHLTTNFTFGGFQVNFTDTVDINSISSTNAIDSLIVSEGNNIIIGYSTTGVEIPALSDTHILTLSHSPGTLTLNVGIVSSYPDDIGFAITTTATVGNCSGGINIAFCKKYPKHYRCIKEHPFQLYKKGGKIKRKK